MPRLLAEKLRHRFHGDFANGSRPGEKVGIAEPAEDEFSSALGDRTTPFVRRTTGTVSGIGNSCMARADQSAHSWRSRYHGTGMKTQNLSGSILAPEAYARRWTKPRHRYKDSMLSSVSRHLIASTATISHGDV